MTEADYKRAAQKLAGRDRVGIAAEGVAAGLGAAAGVAASGSLTAAFGATTLLGSTTLASVLGGVFVTATPVGWVVGSAMAAGAVGYGIARACHSGGQNDYIRKIWKKKLEERAAETSRELAPSTTSQSLEALLERKLAQGLITEARSTDIRGRVASGHWSESDAVGHLEALKLGH